MQPTSRDEVLDAVAASVRDLGVRRTTMAEIARRAGLSRSTIYRHFADVTEATAALLTGELVRLLGDAIEDPDPEVTARERLVTQALHLARTVRDDPLIERILALDAELVVPYVVQRLGSSQRAILDVIVEEVRTGQREGSIRDGDPRAIAMTVFLVGQAFVLSSAIVEAELGRERALAELATTLERLLAPGGSSATGEGAG